MSETPLSSGWRQTHLGRLLGHAMRRFDERVLHLMAHSMGAYVLRHGLQAIRAKDPRALVRVFDQILLVAADEDDDAFETDEKLKPLSQIGRQVTVYFNPNDRALVISDKTKGNRDRLGSDGPRLVDLIPKIYDTERIARIIQEDGESGMIKINPMQQEPVKKIVNEQGIVIEKIYKIGRAHV
mgnify:CR=1 FL=1